MNMKEETVSYELVLNYPPGSLNPIDFNEHYLESVGIVDENNSINRAMLRIGSIGTNIVFSNPSKDEIRIQPTSLRIESKNLDRVNVIINGLKDRFGGMSIQHCNFIHDVHLIDDSFPESVFNKYKTTNSLELDVIQFKSGNMHLVMYSCAKQKLHLRIGVETKFGKRLSQLDFREALEIDKLNDLYREFLEKEITS